MLQVPLISVTHQNLGSMTSLSLYLPSGSAFPTPQNLYSINPDDIREVSLLLTFPYTPETQPHELL